MVQLITAAPETLVATGGAFPSIATLSNGNYVSAWSTLGPAAAGDGSAQAVLSEVYAPDGHTISGPSVVNTTTYLDQNVPTVAALAGGGFVIAWIDKEAAVKSQTFDDQGAKVGPEQTIGSIAYYDSDLQLGLSGLADGGFVVSYGNGGNIVYKTYNASGGPLSSGTIEPGGYENGPTVQALSNDNFVAIWNDQGSTSGDSDGGLLGQIFSAGGDAVSSMFQVNTTLPGSQGKAKVAALPDGGFVAVWTEDGLNGTNTGGIRAQSFDSEGRKVGGEIDVSALQPSQQDNADVAALSWGGYLVTWEDYTQVRTDQETPSIRAQLFDSDGTRLGAEVQLNNAIDADEALPTIALLSDREAVIDWYTTIGNSAGLKQSVVALPMVGTLGNDSLLGTTGDDAIAGRAGDDSIIGNDGADALDGGIGNDRVDGGNGDDTLSGGAGTDILTGGFGTDTFVDTLAGLSGDQITDLRIGEQIVFTDATLAGFSFNLDDSTLSYGSGQSVTLSGFSGGLKSEEVAGGGVALVAVGRPTSAYDFDGNEYFDILWRNGNGALSTWTVANAGSGAQVTQGAYNSSIDASWQVSDSFDFNGDGKADILWRQSGGSVAVWDSTGSGFDQGSYYRPSAVPTSWRIAGTGDLNGDGKDDLLWQNSDGQLSTWNSTGTGFQEAAYSRAAVASNWKAEDLADFNGDGLADILWRSTDGGVSTWLNNGQGGFNEGSFYQSGVANSWHVVGTGDFNGDGKDDILWRNDNGDVTVWQADSAGSFSEGLFDASAPTSWHVAQVADFNDDGKADILWRNDNGAISTWQSNGSGFDQGVYNSSAPTSWSVAAHQFVL